MVTSLIQKTPSTHLHHLHFPSVGNKADTVLLFPTWAGISEFEKSVATKLNHCGYDVILVDIFGVGVDLETIDARKTAMSSLLSEFQQLRHHLISIIKFLNIHARSSKSGLKAVGYCLGGLCAIQATLFTSDVCKGASFHGLLNFPLDSPNHQCLAQPTSLLIMNGSSDPMVPLEVQQTVKDYFSTIGIDWIFIDYGNAMHSFTLPSSNSPENGVQYHQYAAHHSWSHLIHFLED